MARRHRRRSEAPIREAGEEGEPSRGRGFGVPIGNASAGTVATARDLAAVLRGVAIERAPDDPGLRRLGVADQAGVMDVFAGDAEVITVRNDLPIVLIVTGLGDLAAILRGVIFVGRPSRDHVVKVLCTPHIKAAE